MNILNIFATHFSTPFMDLSKKQSLSSCERFFLKSVGFLLFAFLMAACSVSNEVVLQIDSNPKGAKILNRGKVIGSAPLTVTHNLTDEDKKRGYFMLMPLSFRWLSGAERHSKGVVIQLADGVVQNIIFERPQNAPGELVDVNYGLELQKLSAMNAQAEYARLQAAFMHAERMDKIWSE